MEAREPTPGLIYKKMAAVLADIRPVAKTDKNRDQGYSFRSIIAMADMIQPILASHGIFVVPELVSYEAGEYKTHRGTTMHHVFVRMAYHFWAEDGSVVSCEVLGEGADTSDKAANKAMSAAQKYALAQAFTVPFGEDSERESPEVQGARSPSSKPRSVPGADGGRTADSSTSSIFDQPMGFGRFSKRTWKWLVYGDEEKEPAKPGGGRYGWIEHMISVLEPSPSAKDQETRERLKVCKDLIDNLEQPDGGE